MKMKEKTLKMGMKMKMKKNADMRVAVLLIIAGCLAAPIAADLNVAADAPELLPYPKSPAHTSSLYVVSEEGRTQAELMGIDVLAGFIARERSPAIYRCATASWRDPKSSDSYSHWLVEMEGEESHYGISVNETLMHAPFSEIVTVLAHKFGLFPKLKSFILCNASDASVSAAITLASAGRDIVLVAGSSKIASSLTSLGLNVSADVMGKTIEDVLSGEVLKNLSKRMFFFQDLGKSQFLADYAVLSRGAYMQWSDAKSRNAVIARADEGMGAAFGWGPENDYVSTLNQAGIFVHASDYNKNLAALSNVMSHGRAQFKSMRLMQWSKKRNRSALKRKSATNNSHTVAFLMTDGDNLQYILGPWSVDQRWYGSPQRGTVPCGWTMSPAIADLAPAALGAILRSQTDNDEMVAGPSGLGYVYPTTWPAKDLQEFADATHGAMKSANMATINILGQNNDEPDCSLIDPMLQGTDGGFFYPWGDGYSALHGKIFWCQGQPLVSGRFSLWGNSTTGDMVGVSGLVKQLLSLPDAPPTSPDAYSLIPVNVWSHSYGDVVAVVEALREAARDRFDIVTPGELLARVRHRLSPP
eukprot:g4756.t1